MKRIFALILVLLMLFPMVMSCKREEPEDPSSSSSSEEPSSSTPVATGPTPPIQHGFTSKESIMTDWSGKTLNVLVTRYGASANYPWGQVELCASSFGEGVGQAFDERQALIKDQYGVDVKWVPAIANQSVSGDLASAEISGGTTTFEIAIPRVHEVQTLVSSVYNMHESDYLDFTHDYFSMSAYESFTVSGYTLFAAGGHDFADEQSSYTMLFNKDMLAEKTPANLYDTIKDGTWTYEALTSISTLVSKDTNNDGYGDEDIYGFGTKSVTMYYYYFGVFEADVDPDTGMYRFALDLDIDKTEQVISLMKAAKSATWARVSGWGGHYGSAMHDAFAEGRLLFFNDVTQKIQEICASYELEFALGVAPFPKLNAEQEDYIVPVNKEQITVICIPKVTQDRQMSEYFLDVLSWTGKDYTVKAYYDIIEGSLDPETSADDMAIIEEHVFGNIAYDIGEITCGSGTSLAGHIKDATLGDSNFTTLIQEEGALLIDTVQGWNSSWGAYTDED
ncbi:MAG: hypothetical protein J6A54_02975 [Clostridia bacterium]|nr:hypothetical protein [Clostridia bacterium]